MDQFRKKKNPNLSCKKIQSELFQDIIESSHYRYLEEWESLALMENHLKFNEFSALLGEMKVSGKISDVKTIQSDNVFQLE